jgi:hypothetical protein
MNLKLISEEIVSDLYKQVQNSFNQKPSITLKDLNPIFDGGQYRAFLPQTPQAVNYLLNDTDWHNIPSNSFVIYDKTFKQKMLFDFTDMVFKHFDEEPIDFDGETQLIIVLKVCYDKLTGKDNQYLQYSDEQGNRITVNFQTYKVVKKYKNMGYKQI